MARDTFAVTTSWQQVASGIVTITIQKQGSGTLFFNETDSDVDANRFTAVSQDQFVQDSAVPTWVRASQDGWEILVDGAL